MEYTIWQFVIFLIASGMVLLSAFCVLFPQKLIDEMPRLINSKLAKYSDLAIRFFLGASLLLSAETAVFPLAFTIFGCFSLVAVIIIVFLGTKKLEDLIKNIASIFPIWLVRLVCLFSVCLFGFLIYNIG